MTIYPIKNGRSTLETDAPNSSNKDFTLQYRFKEASLKPYTHLSSFQTILKQTLASTGGLSIRIPIYGLPLEKGSFNIHRIELPFILSQN